MSMAQDIRRIMGTLKQDQHYVQRNVILSLQQHLLIVDQFYTTMTPTAFKENRIQLSCILPRQSMMVCSDRPVVNRMSFTPYTPFATK